MNYSIKKISLLGLLCMTSIHYPANAEGEFSLSAGVFGANRRVRTNPAGYESVQGTFQVPSIFIPLNNASNSKPSFYIGSGRQADQIEVDAGVQYESGTFPYIDANNQQQYARPGWSVFMAVAGGGRPRPAPVNPPYGWRAGHGTPNPNVTSFFLWHGVVADGSIFLQVRATGANAQPGTAVAGGDGIIWWQEADGNNIAYPNGTTGLHVKRVSAMTQGGQGVNLPATRFREDGSFMRGNAFRDGWVGNLNPQGTSYNWIQWSTASMDQSRTGYYPGGRDKTIPNSNPVRHNRGHLPRINFPALALSDRDDENTARYNNEVVDINLRRFRLVKGRSIRPRQRTTIIDN